MSRESKFQSDLITAIELMIPNAVVMKNDPNYRQGFPDLVVYHEDRFVLLECKRNKGAPEQPNQRYWIDWFGQFTYTAFVYPENKSEVLHAVQQALRPHR